MKFSDLFVLSTRMFKARTSRTFLTILGMSVGIGAIVFLVSLGYGLQDTILQKITTSDSLLTLDVTPEQTSSGSIGQEALDKIKKIGGVAEVSPSYQLNAQGKMDNLVTDLSATVVDSEYLKLSGTQLAQGRIINDDEPQGIIVSTSVSQIFGKNAGEIIGKTMTFTFSLPENGNSDQGNSLTATNTKQYASSQPFTVIGVVDSSDSSIYINTRAMKDISISNFDEAKVKCVNSGVMGAVDSQLTQMHFSVSSLSQTVDQANQVFRIIRMVLMLFGVIALVVSAIGMFNTMTITLLERTEEIGIMKSIGASDQMISMMFVMEATIMGLLGGLVGIAIGYLEGKIFNLVINLIASHFGGQQVNLFSSPLWFVSSVIAFSAVVGFITGVIPARRASKIDPLDALRYK
ncbi:MAG: ABC transporter permease [Candidatus Pacebacteria bacterium]|nr:ABC transporter permease [Candidatus Paceibacterota bacterium]MDR3583063.1 ABC transporter permease [Candidatus Paceibacterota bacterium]